MVSELYSQARGAAPSPRPARYYPYFGGAMGADHAYCSSCGKKVGRTASHTTGTASPPPGSERDMRMSEVMLDPAANQPSRRADISSECLVGGIH